MDFTIFLPLFFFFKSSFGLAARIFVVCKFFSKYFWRLFWAVWVIFVAVVFVIHFQVVPFFYFRDYFLTGNVQPEVPGDGKIYLMKMIK